MKVTYYLAASVDGYIAKPNGDIAWLEQCGIDPQETKYEEFFGSVDAIVMGRATYEVIRSFGDWSYGDTPTWVCSNRPIEIAPGMKYQIETVPSWIVHDATKMGCQHLWVVGGGKLVSTFIAENLLTHISLTVMPILLGGGIPLVSTLPQQKFLHLEKSRTSKSGFVQLDYTLI